MAIPYISIEELSPEGEALLNEIYEKVILEEALFGLFFYFLKEFACDKPQADPP